MLAASISLLAGLTAVLAGTTTSITNGTVVGKECANHDAISYQSLPYAQPPVGDLRFAPPRPYNKTFTGPHQATNATVNCLQFGNSSLPGPQSEDCLFLDVYIPSNATSESRLPVKVWLYGGFNLVGDISDPLYDGCNLASQNTVLVSINYRLGPLGWLALTSAGIDGNMGLQDQLLGLQWVQENIGAFGGDKDKVLLFGESAGATNAFAITTLPQAPSLMKAAVLESGGGRWFPTVQQYEPYMADFVTKLGCSTSDLECIRSKSGAQLNQTVIDSPNNVAFNTPPNAAFAASPPNNDNPAPLVDGKVIRLQPLEVGSKVPTIYGSNAEEGNLFLLSTYGASGLQNLTMKDYNVFLTENFGAYASVVNATYPISAFAHTKLPYYYAMSTITTDSAFKCPAYRGLVNTANQGVPVWTYLFNHTNSCNWIGGDLPPQLIELIGPAHGSEVPYVFENLEHFPLPDGNCSFNAVERDISSIFVNAWTNMAANGSPGGGWPRFYPDTSMGLIFGTDGSAMGPVDYSMCTEFWDVLDAKVLTNDTGNAGGVDPASTTSAAAPGASQSAAASSASPGSKVNTALLVGSLAIGASVIYL